MLRKLIFVGAIVAAVASFASTASAETNTATYALRLTVPVLCRVSFTNAVASAGSAGSVVDLGEVGEYCNAGSGYSVVVDYAPGTLRGAVLQLGDDHVVLDGSGQAVISQAAGPRIRKRHLLATPGANGFDTTQLSFQMHPSA